MSSKNEASSNNNRRIDDGREYSNEVAETYYNTQDCESIDQLIFTPEFAHVAPSIAVQEVANIGQSIGDQKVENIDHQIHPHVILTDQDDASLDLRLDASRRIDGTNGTPTSSINTYRCDKIQLSEERRLPDSVRKLFPGCSEQEIGRILKKAEYKMDTIWAEIDKKYAKSKTTSNLCSQMHNEFKDEFKSYLSKEFSRQVKSINDALSIVEGPSYGIIICNMKNQVLGVQNHYGTWSAVKGHPKIKDDWTLETTWETAKRELFEEISIKFKTSNRIETITQKNIGLLAVNKTNFIKCDLDSRPNTNDRSRLIGLFFVRVDENKWEFSLKDNKENMACKWLKIDDIINNKLDKCYTLRPFVQYLKDHPIY